MWKKKPDIKLTFSGKHGYLAEFLELGVHIWHACSTTCMFRSSETRNSIHRPLDLEKDAVMKNYVCVLTCTHVVLMPVMEWCASSLTFRKIESFENSVFVLNLFKKSNFWNSTHFFLMKRYLVREKSFYSQLIFIF